MLNQELIQDNPKVIPFKVDNSQLALVHSNQYCEAIPAITVGILFIYALALILGLIFVSINLVVKAVIKLDRDNQVSSEFYEQTKHLMNLDFESNSCSV